MQKILHALRKILDHGSIRQSLPEVNKIEKQCDGQPKNGWIPAFHKQISQAVSRRWVQHHPMITVSSFVMSIFQVDALRVTQDRAPKKCISGLHKRGLVVHTLSQSFTESTWHQCRACGSHRLNLSISCPTHLHQMQLYQNTSLSPISSSGVQRGTGFAHKAV